MAHCRDWLGQADQKLTPAIAQCIATGLTHQALQGVPVYCPFGQTLWNQYAELRGRVFVYYMEHQSVCTRNWSRFKQITKCFGPGNLLCQCAGTHPVCSECSVKELRQTDGRDLLHDGRAARHGHRGCVNGPENRGFFDGVLWKVGKCVS
jgi:hypothetical protein